VGDQVFIAGMTASYGDELRGGSSMYEQAAAIFTKIQQLMEAAGGVMNDIVKVNIFVTDIDRREEVWRARREFFSGDFPVSTLIEVSAVGGRRDCLVEIEAVGFIGAGSRA
jgi:enamine deaminase RidA (YjgF/YER057c/UK114 family)